MRITMIDLQCEDIMWFAVDKNGYIMEFTSGGMGNVPEFVCADRETNDLLVDFFMKNLFDSTFEHLEVEYADNDLMNEAISLSRKGIFCFDAVGDSYNLICAPEKPLNVDNLPDDIRKKLESRYIDADVLSNKDILVDHAY